MRVANLPDWAKPASSVKKRERATGGLSGVVGDGVCRKNSRGTWEAQQGWGEKPQHLVGKHNHEGVPCWESERPIVVEKRGNARGAKGPYCKNASNEKGGEPLERETFHNGRTGGNGTAAGRQQTGQDTGETLLTEGEAGPEGQTGVVRPVKAEGESLQESRMREIRTSGSRRGSWVVVKACRYLGTQEKSGN